MEENDNSKFGIKRKFGLIIFILSTFFIFLETSKEDFNSSYEMDWIKTIVASVFVFVGLGLWRPKI